MPEDDELAALREQTSQGDRIDQAASVEQKQILVEAIVEELEAIDDGDQQKTLSVWDGALASFVRALEANPDQMEAVGHSLQQRLDTDTEEIDRSEVLRLALRLGFREAAPEEFDALRDAVQKHATKRL
jgi:hypothetical protein